MTTTTTAIMPVDGAWNWQPHVKSPAPASGKGGHDGATVQVDKAAPPRGLGATPFKAGTGYAPRFPTDKLPAKMRAYVHDIAVRKQVPVDLPALTMLGILGGVAGPRVVVRRDLDWIQPTNIYTACGMESGGGKSPTVEELRLATYIAKGKLAEHHQQKTAKRIDTLTAQMEVLHTKANRTDRAGDGFIGEEIAQLRMQAKELEDEIDQLKADPPSPPELTFDGDTTIEHLATLMAANEGAGAIVDDEGTFLRLLGGMYSGRTGNLGLVLVGYDCRYYTPGRVNRNADIPRAALSLVIAPQPNIIADAMRDQMMDKAGFINRFFVCVPGDLVGQRDERPATYYKDIPTERPDKTGRRWWADLITSIATDYEVIDKTSIDDAPTIDLTRAAFKRHREYEREIEKRLHPETGDLLKIRHWAAKHLARVLRLAALLHLADGKTTADEIDETTMENAISIGDWSIEQYLAAGSVSGLTTDAGRVKEYIDGQDLGFAGRTAIYADVFKKHIGTADLDRVIDELVATGEYHVVTQGTKGRPKRFLCRVGSTVATEQPKAEGDPNA